MHKCLNFGSVSDDTNSIHNIEKNFPEDLLSLSFEFDGTPIVVN